MAIRRQGQRRSAPRGTALQLQQRDEDTVKKLLKSMEVDADPQVVGQLVEQMRRYCTGLLFDAKDYATHAGKPEIRVEDVRLAMADRQEALLNSSPMRSEVMQLADEVNSKPLPVIPDQFGVRLPPSHMCLTEPTFDLVPGSDVLEQQGVSGESGTVTAGANAGASTIGSTNGMLASSQHHHHQQQQQQQQRSQDQGPISISLKQQGKRK